MISDCKWQWMDDVFGPMGWFTNRQKAKVEKEFTNGHWRPITKDEANKMVRSIGSLAYEQS